MAFVSSFLFDRIRFVRNNASSFVLAGIVLFLSLGLTFGLWKSAMHNASEALQAEFDYKVSDISSRIRQRFSAYEYVLRSTHAFFGGSENVSRREFKSFVSSLDLETTYPGIKGIGVAKIVRGNEKEQHVAEIRRQGFPEYRIFPEGDRKTYAPIYLREPFVGNSFGYDQYSEPTRRAAMEMARDSNSIAISDKLQLLGDANAKQVGFVMFFPIYDRSGPAESIEERRERITGWVYIPVYMNALMTGLLAERADELDIEIFDGEVESEASLLFDTDGMPLGIRSDTPRLKTTRRIEVGSHSWTLAVHSLPAFEARLDNGKPFFISVAGTSLSLLLALLTFLLISGRSRALHLASRMTEDLRQSEAHFRFVTEAAQALIWMAGKNKQSTWFNKEWLEFTGRTLAEECGTGWTKGVHPDDLEQCWQTYSASFDRRQPFSMEYRLRHHDGEYRWIVDNGRPFYDIAGNFDGFIGSCFDITERKKAEEELQLSSLVYKSSGEAIVVTDPEGTVLAVNPAFTEVTGYSPQEAIGGNPRLLKSGHHGAEFYEKMWKSLSTTGLWQGEIWNRRKNGEIYPEWLSISSTFNEDGSVHRRVAIFSDITKKKKLEELLWQQANIDMLTGLPNRRMFLDRLDMEIAKSDRSGEMLALLFLDLDHFKDVNDTLGHDMGDTLLKIAAERISGCVRKTDTVARLGGDEFTILLAELGNHDDVKRVVCEILKSLSQPFRLGNEMAFVSASIGITLYPDDAQRADNLLKNADQAMYAAKSEGRNRYQYFTQSMQEAAKARMRMVNDLRTAVGTDQLCVYYQPIVELATGSIHKAEALLRWRHPERGLVSPAEFIPLAEQSGLIVDIGDQVFRDAVRMVKHLRQAHHPDFEISINKSPVQFRNDLYLYKTWFDYLSKLGLPGRSVVIEITESLLMDSAGLVADKLTAFRNAGMQIALDDFGTGYSSLSYLQKFDLDYLKIDQSFVHNLTPDSQSMALCEAIIVMAHKLNIKVIAEGVETHEQRGLLLAAGCDYAQGYLFSRPIPGEELNAFLSAGVCAV